MSEPAGRLGAVVLAGGRSSRFGRDKLAEVIDGRPLLEHAIAAVQALVSDIDIVVVVAPDAQPALPTGVRLARDARAFEGPLAGLTAGMSTFAASIERVVVVGGDQPTLVPDVLSLLLDALGDGVDAAVLEIDGLPRPLPMAVRRKSGAAMAAALLATGERRLRALPEALAARVVDEDVWRALDPDGRSARDVDVPGDL
jgi:molybdopterin-guanine dinucleotide biosynthesis protein A